MACKAPRIVFLLALGLPELKEGIRIAASDNNLCVDGHIAPELYLLGAQCSATSSLADELMVHPNLAFPELLDHARDPYDYFEKELHIFDKDDRYSYGKSFWLNHYPKCAKTPNRTIAVDATPNYMFNETAYERMSKWYGSHARDLKFVLMIREPMQRMHSAFWHYQGQNSYMCEDQFGKLASRVLDETENFTTVSEYYASVQRSHGDPFVGSLYPPQLELFFKYFSPSQLTIVPMTFFTAPKSGARKVANSLFGDLLKIPELPVDEMIWRGGVAERHLGYAAPVLNNHPHPTVESELDGQTLKAMKDVVDRFAGARAVADVLAQKPTVNLYGYEGSKSDAGKIKYWLDQNW